jgi:hypothetical protein
MAEFISIETDLKQVMSAFDALDKQAPKIQRNLLAGIGSKAVSIVKKSYSMSLKKGSGNLYKNIKRMVVRNNNAVVVASKALSENKSFYGFALAKGSTIKAKNQEYLTFKIGDKWFKKHSIKLPERDWFQKPIDEYIGSAAYDAQMEKLLQKEIDKLFKKGILQ